MMMAAAGRRDWLSGIHGRACASAHRPNTVVSGGTVVPCSTGTASGASHWCISCVSVVVLRSYGSASPIREG
jgi:hypothetical protein